MTIVSTGPLSISAISTEFALGNNLGAYKGVTWFTDAGATGTFATVSLTLSSFYGTRKTSPVTNITITSNTANYNLFTASGSPAGTATVNVTINSGVYCYASTTSTYGFRTGLFAAGSTITITDNGFITGAAGAGGAGGAAGQNGTVGVAGGTAFLAEVGCTINGSGQINGGGGGGGGGGSSGTTGNAAFSGGGGGGGGRGLNNAAGGAGGVSVSVAIAASAGAAGSATAAGGGGAGSTAASGESTATGGTGGTGGGWAVAGAVGADGLGQGTLLTGGAGGAAGVAINRNGKTVTTSGITINGAVIG